MQRKGRMGGPAALIALIALTLLAACGSSPTLRADRFYRLEPAPLVGPSGPAAPATLLVNDLSGRNFLGGSQIVFRTREEPLVTQRYEDLLWEEPPTQSMAKALVSALRAAQVFQFVVVAAERAGSDYLLSGELQRFEHRPTDQPPRVAAALHLTLVQAENRRTLASRDFSGEEPVDGPTPDAMVAAFTRLSARLIGEAVREFQTHQRQLKASARP
jgi:cholesterol transport system auxiliary component